jgi:tetratricopeptide (TPR) repeat protein
MSSISNRANIKSVSIFDDKKFVRKFTMMLFVIIALSLTVIFYERVSVVVKDKFDYYSKLINIEKILSGQNIDTDVVVDDFDGLEDLDLSGIEIVTADDIVNQTVTKTGSKNNAKVEITSGDSGKRERSKKIFITSEDISSLSFIKKRFYATNNISFSLMIANRFLEKKDYKKALKWALISNEIDDKDERSWLIFAKVKLAQNKKADAISALKAYLEKNYSANVKKLLDDISK